MFHMLLIVSCFEIVHSQTYNISWCVKYSNGVCQETKFCEDCTPGYYNKGCGGPNNGTCTPCQDKFYCPGTGGPMKLNKTYCLAYQEEKWNDCCNGCMYPIGCVDRFMCSTSTNRNSICAHVTGEKCYKNSSSFTPEGYYTETWRCVPGCFNSANCSTCSPGFYNSDCGKEMPCPPEYRKTYCGGNNPGSCVPCPSGYYCDGTNPVPIVPNILPRPCSTTCPTGQFLFPCTSTSNSMCIPCTNKPESGAVYTSYSLVSNNCSWQCVAGYAMENPGNCTACEQGKFNNAPGQSSCLPCSPGTFNNESGMTFCYQCSNTVETGKYVSGCGGSSAGTVLQCTNKV